MAAATVGSGGCTGELPPYGEALLVVDTDAPLRLAQQLRVDVYTSDGRWIESRTLPRLDPQDWPASFSVVAPTDGGPTDALVRLRAHPSGRLRDYLGERFEPRPEFVPLKVPMSLEEGCSDPEMIELGHSRWLRAGDERFIEQLSGGTCDALAQYLGDAPMSEIGSVVAAVEILERGDYRFAVLGTYPPFDTQVSLQVRRDCLQDDSWVGCDHGLGDDFSLTGVGPLGYLPQVDLHDLEPGTYSIVTTTFTNVAPVDIQIAVAPIDSWSELPVETRDAPWNWHETAPEPPPQRLELEGAPTPIDEPLPALTIDRLVRLRLVPGEVGSARVVLRGSCFGTMAMLNDDAPEQRPVLDEAESCIDSDGLRLPVETASLEPGTAASGHSLLGTFGVAQACDDGLVSDLAVCVPGGVFLFGDPYLESTLLPSSPERVAWMSPFWIDRREVTVARWRDALARGFVPPSLEDAPLANDGPLGDTDLPPNPSDPKSVADTAKALCTYTTRPGDREHFPVNCLSWHAARAFCRFEGGELTTAAQWEYVATAAGREHETHFPWGNDLPVCSPAECEEEPCHVAANRRTRIPEIADCLGVGFGPMSVLEYEHPEHGDVTVALSEHSDSLVYGLAGNMREYLLDSAHRYAAPCWRSQPLRDPVCWEEHAPVREAKGGTWRQSLFFAYAVNRDPIRGSSRPRYERYPHPYQTAGFRCAYPRRPKGR